MSYVPRESYNDALARVRQLQQKLANLQARLDKYVMREAVSDALADIDPNQSDIDNLRAYLEGSNLRTDGDHAIIDFDKGDGTTLTFSPKDAIELMRSQPERFGALFDRPKPKEPTKQELHNAKLAAMTPKQYMAYRQQRGDDFLTPEAEQV